MNRRIIIFAAMVFAVALMMMPFALAEGERETFWCDGYEYALLDDGTAEIVEGPIDMESIDIPSELDGITVTQIGAFAFSKDFRKDSPFTTVNIPDTITAIKGLNPFGRCINLKNIYVSENNRAFTSIDGVLFSKDGDKLISYPLGRENLYYGIPKGTREIGDGAFMNCSHLMDIDIPDGVKQIDGYAFYCCSLLFEISIPDSVEKIDESAFEKCHGLTAISLSNSLTELSEYMFYYCDSLTSINIPDNVTKIGVDAFGFCSNLRYMNIPGSVSLIDDAAFYGCSSLTSVVISDGVTTIGMGAFAGCKDLTSVVIPDSVTQIGETIFLWSKNAIVVANPDSYAKQYCLDNGLSFVYPDGNKE